MGGAVVAAALAALTVATPVAVAKGRPTYTSPGYKPTRIPKNFVPAKPPPPVLLRPSGNLPHVFVDGAGSAHIAFADPNGAAADIIRTCRLLRGGSACAASTAQSPGQPAAGNDPQTNQDFDGPFPLAIGNELLVVDSRCCNRVPTSDGSFTENPVYLYTSEDAGATFTGPTDANPYAGLIGTQDPSGDAIVYGGVVPSIGLISSAQTGGTIFQGVPAGSFTKETANLSLRPDKQDASEGRLGLDGTRPIAAFSDSSGTITVREWTGSGTVNDASQWTTLRIAGADQPRIAGGPKGIALLTEPSISTGALSVRTIAPGGLSAGPPQVLTNSPARSPTLSADPVSGMFAAAWINTSDESVHVRTSPDGRVWGPDQLVMRVTGGDLGQLDVAATADGGGFVVLRDAKGAPTVYDGHILAGQFGPTGPTGKPGLGLVPGGSGPPSGDQKGFVACSQIHFGSVDIQATAGCFLRDPKNPSGGAGVAESAISLNGLTIVPDPGARIFIDPHSHTIKTEGGVRVIAQGAGSAPVTLWHGPLSVTLPPGDDLGATLFDFPMNEFAANVEGFGISAQAKVVLSKDGVRIPVDLKMPDYFGGITGHAELLVDAKSGLHLDSLNFNIPDVDIGALELQNAHVQYQSGKWDGGARLIIPGPGISVDANLHFANGAFNGGDFQVTDFPGVPVFTDVFLTQVRLGFQLKPTVFTGGVTFGFQPVGDRFTIAVAGDFRIEEGPPFAIQITGTGSVVGVQIASAFFRYATDGTLIVRGDISIGSPKSWGIAGGAHFGIIGSQWGGEFNVQGCGFPTPVSDAICVSATADANSRGIAVCLGDVGGITHDWSDPIYDIEPHAGSCAAGKYAPPAGVSRALPRAPTATTTFTVPPGATAFNVALDGDSGIPDVTLTGPGGAPIVFGDPRSAKAVQMPGNAPGHTDYLGLRQPAAGTYTIRTTPGSPAIVGLRVSRGYATPTATATVGGSGRQRTLRYTVKPVAGVGMQFVEAGPAGDTIIGMAKGTTGTLHFRSGAGPGGRRTIVARAVVDGLAETRAVVAHYAAPAIPKPGPVGHLRISRTRGSLSIRFNDAAGAKTYAVKVLLSDGRGLQRSLNAPKTRLAIPKVGILVRAQVTVTPVGPDGRRGPARTTRLR